MVRKQHLAIGIQENCVVKLSVFRHFFSEKFNSTSCVSYYDDITNRDLT